MSDEPTLGEYVEIAAFSVMGEAMTAAVTLEAAGIPVHVRNEQISSVLPHMANAFGGIGVCVPTEDADEARELLAGASPAEAEAPGETAGAEAVGIEPNPEPVLDSPRAAVARRAWRAAVFGLVFLPVILHAISLWLLARFATTSGPTSARSRRQAIGALLLDGLVAAGVAGILFLAYGGP